eukprot:618392-Ditylum_brightwellii.AAC.1
MHNVDMEKYTDSLIFDDDTYMPSIESSSTHPPAPNQPAIATHTNHQSSPSNNMIITPQLSLLLDTYPEYRHIIKRMAANGKQPTLIAKSVQDLVESAEQDHEL